VRVERRPGVPVTRHARAGQKAAIAVARSG
jgi:hypothetical protein